MNLTKIKQLDKPLQSKPFENYLITDNGDVWSNLKHKFLKPLVKPKGYKQVYLKDKQGKSKWHYVHRLVAILYVDNPDNKPEVNHLDNNPSNNHYTNLKWVTHQENIQHSIDQGRFKTFTPKCGKDHPQYNKPIKAETKVKMREAKQGEKHPKFKGYYEYNGKRATSLNDLAIQLGTYPMHIKRLKQKGLVTFIPKDQSKS